MKKALKNLVNQLILLLSVYLMVGYLVQGNYKDNLCWLSISIYNVIIFTLIVAKGYLKQNKSKVKIYYAEQESAISAN